MTKRAKLLVAAAMLAGLGAAAMPALAAETGAAGPNADVQTAFQTAFGADDGRSEDRPGHPPDEIGPGGPGGLLPGRGPGFGFPADFGFGPAAHPVIAALLDQADVNHDGKLDQAQIDAVVGDLLKKYDKDGDGTLSLEEYQALFNDVMQEAMVRSFQSFDRNGDGRVTADELKGPMRILAGRMTHGGAPGRFEGFPRPPMGPGFPDGPASPPPDQNSGG
jgi:hypothetical protein